MYDFNTCLGLYSCQPPPPERHLYEASSFILLTTVALHLVQSGCSLIFTELRVTSPGLSFFIYNMKPVIVLPSKCWSEDHVRKCREESAQCLAHSKRSRNEPMMVIEFDGRFGSATHLLCDLGQVLCPLRASVFLTQ